MWHNCKLQMEVETWNLKPETWNHYSCPTNPATAIAPFTHGPTHTELRETLWKKKAPNEYTWCMKIPLGTEHSSKQECVIADKH